jgi:hypothetical protein
MNVIMLSVIHYAECHYAEVIMLSVVMLNVIRLSVMAPQTEVYLTIVNHNSTSVTMHIVQAIAYWIPSC